MHLVTNTIATFIIAFIEDDSILIFLIGFLGTFLTVAYMATKALANKKPVKELLESYRRNSLFTDMHFEINENNTILGKINNFDIEITPKLNGDKGINFILIIDLANKPYFNNHSNLRHAFGRQKFMQVGSRVILNNWEPNLFNYAKFNKIIDLVNELLCKIENKKNINMR